LNRQTPFEAVLAAYLALGVIAVISIPALYSWVLVVPIFAVAGYFKNIRIFPAGYWLWPTGEGRRRRSGPGRRNRLTRGRHAAGRPARPAAGPARAGREQSRAPLRLPSW
jgi:hypothetical protein